MGCRFCAAVHQPGGLQPGEQPRWPRHVLHTGESLLQLANSDLLLLLQEPTTLEELKEVLGVVAAIRGEGMMMELCSTELEERYRTRLLYAVSMQSAMGFPFASSPYRRPETSARCAAC